MRSASSRRRLFRELTARALQTSPPPSHSLLSSSCIAFISSSQRRNFMRSQTSSTSYTSPGKILVSYDAATANEHLAELLNERDVVSSLNSKHKFAVLGFDTETRPTFNKNLKKNKVALVQFASKNVACLIHLASMKGEIPEVMTKILREKEYVLLGFGIKTDLEELKVEHYDNDGGSVDVNGFIDLATISEVFKHERPGMKGMANHYGLDLEKPKAVQISNWENSPLREGQVKYAAEDASLGVWLAERMYEEYGSRRNNDDNNINNKNASSQSENNEEDGEEDDRYDGFLRWMFSFRNAENTKKLNKRQLPKDAAELVFDAELQTVNKYATLRFQDAKKLLKQYRDGKKHPTATMMEFFNSLSKTLPNEYTKDGRGFEIVRFTHSVSKTKNENGQDVSVFSCECKWEDLGETVAGCSGYGESSTKKGAKAEACKNALSKCEEWLKSFENQWFFELALEEKQKRLGTAE
jgi:ribonuclease D